MTGDCSAVHCSPPFSAFAWPDSSYDRHAGKRTITGKVRWLSRGERERRISLDSGSESCLTHSGLQTELSNYFWNSSDTHKRFLQAAWPTIFFDIRRWTATWCELSWLNGIKKKIEDGEEEEQEEEEGEKKNASVTCQKWFLICACSISGSNT